MLKPFKSVRPLHPGRSTFDLSYQKLLTMDMGQLIPVTHDELIPGDRISLGAEVVIRMAPLVSPILHEINAYYHAFFVPARLLWADWESFISGGEDGEDDSVLPRWEPTNTAVGSLWDYFGFPPGVDPDGAYPIQFPLNAYNLIWNTYYRDETQQPEVALDQENILYRSYQKDYFTSALPFQQRGIAPSIPLTGQASAVWGSTLVNEIGFMTNLYAVNVQKPSGTWAFDEQGQAPLDLNTTYNSAYYSQVPSQYMNQNTIDLSGLGTFNATDIRTLFQCQKWMERNARCGARYTEFLHSHFGVSPRDERLQRPEYLGGLKVPIIISETLQTSETNTTPQGNMAGHGIAVGRDSCAVYRAEEFGYLIGLFSIMPKPMYTQGINRQWLRRSKYDFPFPEFVNLSEQAIERAEIFASDVEAENTDIWGYQGKYDELRYKPNMACGLMRTDFSYWHLGRIFQTAPALNADFLKCDPDKRIFAVPTEPGFFVTFGNHLIATRPIPAIAEPGLLDH